MVFLDYLDSSCLCDMVFNALSSFSTSSLPGSNNMWRFCIGEFSLCAVLCLTYPTYPISQESKHADRSRKTGLVERYMAGIWLNGCDPKVTYLLHDKSGCGLAPSLIDSVYT